jgi:hypothetical protein
MVKNLGALGTILTGTGPDVPAVVLTVRVSDPETPYGIWALICPGEVKYKGRDVVVTPSETRTDVPPSVVGKGRPGAPVWLEAKPVPKTEIRAPGAMSPE